MKNQQGSEKEIRELRACEERHIARAYRDTGSLSISN